jgi:hypothetical protein
LGKVTAIVDWEMAGWWPAYWEYRKAVYGDCGSDAVWLRLVPQIMEEYQKDARTEQFSEYH